MSKYVKALDQKSVDALLRGLSGDNYDPEAHTRSYPEDSEDKQEGIKYDHGKPRYDLIPPTVLNRLAKVLTYGAAKYIPNGWKHVAIERYVSAMMRHFESWRMGEQTDDESKMHHLDHALTCLVFINYLAQDLCNE